MSCRCTDKFIFLGTKKKAYDYFFENEILPPEQLEVDLQFPTESERRILANRKIYDADKLQLARVEKVEIHYQTCHAAETISILYFSRHNIRVFKRDDRQYIYLIGYVPIFENILKNDL